MHTPTHTHTHTHIQTPPPTTHTHTHTHIRRKKRESQPAPSHWGANVWIKMEASRNKHVKEVNKARRGEEEGEWDRLCSTDTPTFFTRAVFHLPHTLIRAIHLGENKTLSHTLCHLRRNKNHRNPRIHIYQRPAIASRCFFSLQTLSKSIWLRDIDITCLHVCDNLSYYMSVGVISSLIHSLLGRTRGKRDHLCRPIVYWSVL